MKKNEMQEIVEVIDEPQAIAAIDIIKDIDHAGMINSLKSINDFQELVKSQFKQNHDFGIIPGTKKPTLLKPGAEKLVMLLGLTTEFEIVDSTRDFEKGFFQYQTKCKLKRGDVIITEGMGSSNTKEAKNLKLNPYSIDNTVLKVAKKRALVDAALLVGSLSDIFTQDLEDDIAGESINQKRYYTSSDGTISKAQARRIFALADGDETLVKRALAMYDYSSSLDVKKSDYEGICKVIQNSKTQGAETEDETDGKA